jgi:hypothetical protein
VLNNYVRSVSFGERVIEFDQPAQPGRAGEGLATGSKTPYEGDEQAETDEAENNGDGLRYLVA